MLDRVVDSLVFSVLCLCSAGVGRTGTFIVIDGVIDMMHQEQKIDVFGFVSKIRDQRSQLVQTDVSTVGSKQQGHNTISCNASSVYVSLSTRTSNCPKVSIVLPTTIVL